MSEQVAAVTNGDVVEKVIGRVRARAGELAAYVRDHPDEAVVAALPVLLAFRLSAKYQMDFADHMLVCETSQAVSLIALRTYREWKARPARPAEGKA